MMSDITFAALFASVLFSANTVILVCVFLLAAVSGEIFSTLPFGVLSFSLLIGVLAMKKLARVFDETSKASSFVTFLGGLFVYFVLIGIARFWFFGGDILEHAVRSAIQYGRSALFTLIFIGCIIGIRLGVGYIKHAFTEEKIASL